MERERGIFRCVMIRLRMYINTNHENPTGFHCKHKQYELTIKILYYILIEKLDSFILMISKLLFKACKNRL
ncbi:hypothetical protein CDL62_03805 [Alkalitalea saponilacus]|nr:hypothetical protein CDL62_03805 [Alkalitalea saponilacus]